MSTVYSPARTPGAPALEPSVATIQAASPGFDERWKEWQAKGAAHDRAVRRKLTIAAPFIAIAAGAIFYAMAIR
jgi:hypothetical protein